MTGYGVTIEFELTEHFGRWSIHSWTKHHQSRINGAGEDAGKLLMEEVFRHAVADGFALAPEAE